MRIFKKKSALNKDKSLTSSDIIKTPKNGSKISRCMVINGPIKSCEPIVIDGIVNGEVVCEDSVIVSSGAIVKGEIYAKEVRIDGIVEAPIEANLVAISKDGSLTGYMIVTDAFIEGKSDGDILVKESLYIQKGAKVSTLETKAQVITISGEIIGDIIASEIVDLKKSAIVDGNIYTDELETQKGSVIFGLIYRYNEYISKDELKVIV